MAWQGHNMELFVHYLHFVQRIHQRQVVSLTKLGGGIANLLALLQMIIWKKIWLIELLGGIPHIYYHMNINYGTDSTGYRVCKDNLVNASCQWEMTLHCNVVSHCLGAYTKWSLGLCDQVGDLQMIIMIYIFFFNTSVISNQKNIFSAPVQLQTYHFL